MREQDMEQLLRGADFTAGSGHRERLRRVLFAPGLLKESGGKKSGAELSDDELALAAAGTAVEDGSRLCERCGQRRPAALMATETVCRFCAENDPFKNGFDAGI